MLYGYYLTKGVPISEMENWDVSQRLFAYAVRELELEEMKKTYGR